WQLQVLPLGDEGIGFGNQYLRHYSSGAFTCDFSQGIVDRFGLTERDAGAHSRHGVSLLSGGSSRLDTRLDTPPSIKRRHPDSRLAPSAPPWWQPVIAAYIEFPHVGKRRRCLLFARGCRLRSRTVLRTRPANEARYRA